MPGLCYVKAGEKCVGGGGGGDEGGDEGGDGVGDEDFTIITRRFTLSVTKTGSLSTLPRSAHPVYGRGACHSNSSETFVAFTAGFCAKYHSLLT